MRGGCGGGGDDADAAGIFASALAFGEDLDVAVRYGGGTAEAAGAGPLLPGVRAVRGVEAGTRAGPRADAVGVFGEGADAVGVFSEGAEAGEGPCEAPSRSDAQGEDTSDCMGAVEIPLVEDSARALLPSRQAAAHVARGSRAGATIRGENRPPTDPLDVAEGVSQHLGTRRSERWAPFVSEISVV